MDQEARCDPVAREGFNDLLCRPCRAAGGRPGFERDFSLLDGGGSYWDMKNVMALSPRLVFTEDGRYLSKLPDDYYATKTYTDRMIEFIDAVLAGKGGRE